MRFSILLLSLSLIFSLPAAHAEWRNHSAPSKVEQSHAVHHPQKQKRGAKQQRKWKMMYYLTLTGLIGITLLLILLYATLPNVGLVVAFIIAILSGLLFLAAIFSEPIIGVGGLVAFILAMLAILEGVLPLLTGLIVVAFFLFLMLVPSIYNL